jgi:arsenite transporter
MFFLAVLFLQDYPEYMAGLIIIGLARCIAMVIVWNELAKGDTEYAAGLVAFNSIFQVLFFSVYAYVFLNCSSGSAWPTDFCCRYNNRTNCRKCFHIPWHSFLSGMITRFTLCLKVKSKEWYEKKFIPQN